ncbi:hypothetical protein E2I00_007423 [Balaenoptera physalus]|uniref:Uncharacterized protein n=1 Tax=Balaenoptera physalus TaxID=9770 RepID=A0A6A1Q7Y3_BALPH|nr:hypothetical protein E2I00_007423 [Balaenoptera physalus]
MQRRVDTWGPVVSEAFPYPHSLAPSRWAMPSHRWWCLKTHLPGFVEQAGALKTEGIQVVAGLRVNDVFVTEGQGRAHNTKGKGGLPADPTVVFGQETHLLLDDSFVFLFEVLLVTEEGGVKSMNGTPWPRLHPQLGWQPHL